MKNPAQSDLRVWALIFTRSGVQYVVMGSFWHGHVNVFPLSDATYESLYRRNSVK